MAGDRAPSDGHIRVLDPFAGTGRIHGLGGVVGGIGVDTVGVELEPEWAQMSPGTIVGDALNVVEMFGARSFDAVMTSPCYGNRMADHHDAKDRCRECNGLGEVDDPFDPTGRGRCEKCKGSGLSNRNTYKAKLGRDPSPGSAAIMQWGPEYRRFHRDCLAGFRDVLVDGGRLVVNMKNHKRGEPGKGPVEQLVVEWWLATMLAQDLRLLSATPVRAQGNRQGENGHTHRDENIDDDPRVDVEFILVAERPVGR